MKRDVIDRDDPIWAEVNELAGIAAGRVIRRFRRWISFDDARQAGLEYAWKRNDVVDMFLNREDEDDRKQGRSGLIRALERAAERVARREKATQSGYRIEDEYFYSEVTVEKLVTAWAGGTGDLVGQTMDPDMTRRRSRPASEGSDLPAMLADIDAALKRLDARSYGVLLGRLEGVKLEELAEEWDISHQRVDQIQRNAVQQIIEYLGGYRP